MRNNFYTLLTIALLSAGLHVSAIQMQAQTVYFINAAQWTDVVVAVSVWENESWATIVHNDAMTKTTEQVNGFDIYSYALPEGYSNYSLAFDDSQSSERSHTTGSNVWPEGSPYFCVNGLFDSGMGWAQGDWYASLDAYMEAAANAQFKHLHIDDLYYNLNPDNQTAEVTYDMFESSNNYSGLAGTVIPATVEYESVTYNVTGIGKQAFQYCVGLYNIEIPNSVAYISDQAFQYCTVLRSITCHASQPPACGTDAFGYVDNALPVYVPQQSIEAYQAADTWKAFTNIQAIAGTEQQEITNPVLIGDLYYNLNAEDQTAEVTYEVQGSSTNYPNLTNVTIPSSIDHDNATYTVAKIGDWTFSNCSSLTEVTIPNSVTSIGDDAFYYCRGLSSLSIPISITNIGTSAFSGCSGLTSIVVEDGNTTYDNRGNCNAIIETSTNMLIVGCQSTIIPNTVTSIGASAFEYCNGLTNITIPASVTNLYANAFYGCTNLASISCEATTPPTHSQTNIFGNVDKSIPLYVPAASISAYQTAYCWNEFTNIQAIPGSNPQVTALTVSDVCQGEAMTTVTYTTSDATTYQYYIVGQTPLSEVMPVSERGTFILDISAFPAGEYTLKFVANSDNYSSDTATATFAIHPLPTIAITSIADQCYPSAAIAVYYNSTDATTVSYLVKSGAEVVLATDRVNAQSTGTFMLDATALPPGIYTIEATAQSPYGCESTLTTASFNILAPAEHIEESATTCAGESLTWRGLSCTEAGIYNDTVRNNLGCDSAIYTLRLTVIEPIEYDAENVTICAGETYIWRGMELTEVGEYESTLMSIDGCDSIRFRLALTIIEPVEHETDYITITIGDTITWREQQIIGSEPGEFTYTDEVTSGQRCPTDIYTLQLTVEEKPEEQPTISIFGEEVVITDSTGVEMDQVDILGDSTMIYTPEDNTLTLDNVDLTVGEDVSTAISYTGSQPLIIVLCNFSVIYADTVISSTASIIITGDGQLSVEGTVPIFGLPTASITFNSVNMHARSVPGAQALRRRIRSGKMLDETGGPALSGFGSADFNKTNVSPSGALYGPVNIPDGNGGLTATNALYIINGNGEQEVLTEFYLTAEGTGVETVRPNQPFDPTQPAYNILGLQVDESYHGIVIQNGRSYLK